MYTQIVLDNWHEILSSAITKEFIIDLILEKVDCTSAHLINTKIYEDWYIKSLIYPLYDGWKTSISIRVTKKLVYYTVVIQMGYALVYSKHFNDAFAFYDELNTIQTLIVESIEKLNKLRK